MYEQIKERIKFNGMLATVLSMMFCILIYHLEIFCCFMWARKLISHSEGRKWAENIRKWGGEEDI
jgi:hypothetical protein